jgi:hypothetical protein
MSESGSGFIEVAGLVVAGLALLVWFLWRHPRILLGLVALTAGWWLLRVPGVVALVLGASVLLVLWRLVHRRSFRYCVGAPPWAGRAAGAATGGPGRP